MKVKQRIFGTMVNGTRVIPLEIKIVVLFSIFLIVSNFASNYINLIWNRGELIKLQESLLVKDLSEICSFAGTQHDIFQFGISKDEAIEGLEKSAKKNLKGQYSATFGIDSNGNYLFFSSKKTEKNQFTDTSIIEDIRLKIKDDEEDGKIEFVLNNKSYFGVYKYNKDWDSIIIRAEEREEFYAATNGIFVNIGLIIIGMTVIFIIVGIILLRYLLRFMNTITESLMKMQENQKLELIDLSGAPNDNVTYLGASFNSLSSSINNLLSIFRRFVTKDVAIRAYQDREVKLEGSQRELTILFSDIKGFTFMTETLGNDIISLLNIHYDRAIRQIHYKNGIVGSIIGDALLVVYGTLPTETNKSLEAVQSAYLIQDVAADLRAELLAKKDELVVIRGDLSNSEERVFKAALLEVGVGIDGGEVFYGNIGSYERMTNTVIGDNVNSASRLEGLTRVYRVPVICSDFVKDEIGENNKLYYFLELDTVQVKGKTKGKKIYWPIKRETINKKMQEDIAQFERGLNSYYEGSWREAEKYFENNSLYVSELFKYRIADSNAPEGWNGIWTMETK